MDFNEIKNTWKDSFKEEHLNKTQIETLLKIKSKSNNALSKVRNNFKFEIIVGSIVFIAIIIKLILTLDSNVLFEIIAATTIFFGVLLYIVWRSFHRIKNTIISTDQLKITLIKSIIDVEKYVNFSKSSLTKYILLPFAILFGLCVGLFIGTGEDNFIEILKSLENRSIIKIVLVFVIGSAIFIPISQYINKLMYKQHLDELKQCLKEFEESENE